MQKKEMKILLYCFLMSVATGLILYFVLSNQEKKIIVVDAVKLFDGYNMKKELEGMAKGKLEAESKQLDSAGNLLQRSRATSGQEEIKKLEYQYNYTKNKLDEDYKQSNHDINEQVWKRLNPLLDEYGKKKHLHIIIGANGMGDVLYVDNTTDYTNELIDFVNKRYAEGN